MDRTLLSKAQKADLAKRLAEERLGRRSIQKSAGCIRASPSIRAMSRASVRHRLVASGADRHADQSDYWRGYISTSVGLIFFYPGKDQQDGKLFKIVKFRNMTNATDERGELLPAAQRVTKFGSFVRKTSLDELLNFWSILKGDMSLIGPRPLTKPYLGRFSARHMQRQRRSSRLECPASRRARQSANWQDQFENDIWYVENVLQDGLQDDLVSSALLWIAKTPRSRPRRSAVPLSATTGTGARSLTTRCRSSTLTAMRRGMRAQWRERCLPPGRRLR